MIASVLIANRGEIARRIIRTAGRMGVRSVAVFSEADAGAPHVREADEAVLIGQAPAAESYLCGARILDAAIATGAEAIHPGYGFLSENAEFARQVVDAGRIWVGPPAAAIQAMGRKDAAKRLMSAAGVPVTPGYLGDEQGEARLAKEAEKIGWPVLIKAVAGGGGKGMRKVEGASDFAAALASARREAASAFGDDRVLLEKFVARPRHLEVQVFADGHGNVLHLFERDCSLQRRHQKVIEEAPAPGMSPEVREHLTSAALRAARAVDYRGAGTVEFIADGSDGLQADRLWFMEMNTRLQVEHPVTEAVTGLDLVEWQLRVAAGEALPMTQEEIVLTGHAMEARLYAEDPAHGFLPSTGPLARFRLPTDVRVDTGVEEGGEVGPFYDPMIAKLIAHADTREAAAAVLARACRGVEVWPVKTNAAFLARCAADPDFIAGEIDTGFIEARLEALTTPPSLALSRDMVTALHAASAVPTPTDVWSPAMGPLGFRLNAAPRLSAHVVVDGTPRELAVVPGDGAAYMVAGDGLAVFVDGAAFGLSLTQSRNAGEAASGDGAIRSPMPGRIVALSARTGERVAGGQTLVVLEAMKMEHALAAPFSGRVAEVLVGEGAQVSESQILVRLEPQPD